MRFYYMSIFSLIFIAVLYLVALGIFWFIWSKVLKRKFSGPAVWTIVLVILVAPWTEELWIAYQFGQLCRKEAGIFINKTVEVEGYYDATAGLRQIYNPLPEVTSKNFDQRGFKFYEMSMADPRGGPSKVAHFEKVNGRWVGTVLDKPTVRYEYQWPAFNVRVSHKIYKQSEAVVDSKTGEVLAGSNRFGRKSPWFFIALDDPGMSCPRPGEDPLKRPGLLYMQVLQPKSS